MKCYECRADVGKNFVVINRKAYHHSCLMKKQRKEHIEREARATFIECNECHKNCASNRVSYKGWSFHPACLAKRLIRNVGEEQARKIQKEIFK